MLHQSCLCHGLLSYIFEDFTVRYPHPASSLYDNGDGDGDGARDDNGDGDGRDKRCFFSHVYTFSHPTMCVCVNVFDTNNNMWLIWAGWIK